MKYRDYRYKLCISLDLSDGPPIYTFVEFDIYQDRYAKEPDKKAIIISKELGRKREDEVIDNLRHESLLPIDDKKHFGELLYILTAKLKYDLIKDKFEEDNYGFLHSEEIENMDSKTNVGRRILLTLGKLYKPRKGENTKEINRFIDALLFEPDQLYHLVCYISKSADAEAESLFWWLNISADDISFKCSHNGKTILDDELENEFDKLFAGCLLHDKELSKMVRTTEAKPWNREAIDEAEQQTPPTPSPAEKIKLKDEIIKHLNENLLCYHSSDRSSLRDVLLKDPLANAVPFEGIRHPAHDEINNPNGKCLRIVGVPGSGKSFFLNQLLATFKDADVMFLTSLVLTEVADNLRQLRQSASRPLVIVIDNIHYQVGKLQYFNEVCNILRGQPKHSELPVTILVTHWSSERLKIERDVPQYHWDSWDFEEINLDNPSREFISEVVESVCEHLQIEVDDGIQDAFIKEIIGWENTPACAVASLWPYRGKSLRSKHGFYPVMLKVRDQSWRHLFEELQKENIPEYATLLKSLSVLRWCGSKCDLTTVREIATKVGKASESALDYAIERLESSGWVKQDGTTIHSHDLQIFPQTVGLYNDTKSSLFLDRFYEMIIKDELPCLRAERIDVLHLLSVMFENMKQFQKAIELNNAILAHDPKNVRALCDRGVLLIKSEKLEDGLSDMSKAMEIAPSEIRPARIRYLACRRFGRRDDALATLQQFQQHLLHNSLGWDFLAQSFADLKETEFALSCGKQLVRARRDDSEAHAIFAQILWLAGKRGRAVAVIDGALKRWPNGGTLLFVKADFERQVHGVKEALPFAEKALRMKPNSPNMYALVAICCMESGDYNRASEIAETGTELFKFWSDLLTVRGLTLEQQGRLKEALQFLLQAYERSETLSDIYRPSLLLGLGRVFLRLGDKENAEKWFNQAIADDVGEAFILESKAGALRFEGKTEEAIHVLEEGLNSTKDSPDLWVKLGEYCGFIGRYNRSILAFRTANKLKPRNLKIIAYLGQSLFCAEHFEEALMTWQQAIDINQDSCYVWGQLGHCLHKLSKYDEAATAFETAIAKGDSTAETSRNYVFTLASLGRLSDALGYCQQMLLRDSNDALAYVLKAHCYIEQDKHEDAQCAALKAFQLGDDNEYVCRELYGVLGHLGLVEQVLCLWRNSRRSDWAPVILTEKSINQCLEFLFKQSDDVLLMEFLESINEKFKPNEINMTNMALCATRLERLDRATEIYDAILQCSPLNLVAVGERAKILLRLGRHEELFSLESVIYKDLDPWLAAIYLAEAFAAAQKKEKTVDAFLTAVRELPDPPSANTPSLAIQQLPEVAEHLGIREVLEIKFGLPRFVESASGAEAHLAAALTSESKIRLEQLRAGHALDPNRLLLTADLARAELYAGNQQKAIELCRSIAQSESSTTITLATAANVLIESGASAEESLLLADRAIELAQQSGRELWYAQLQKAESLNCLGRFEEALPVGKSALASVVRPSTVMAVLRSLQPLGHLEEALELAKTAIDQFPEEIQIKTTLAFLLKLTGRDNDCIELVKSMGEKGSAMVTPLLDMGDCLVRIKRYEEALKCYRTIRKNLEGKGILEDYYVRAVGGEVDTVVKQGEKKQALRILNALEENYLINSSLWFMKATLIADLELYSEGVILAVERAKVAPNDPHAVRYKAQCLWQLNKTTEALSVIDLAGKLEGKATSSTLNLKALILADMNRYEEAMNLFVKAMEVDTESSVQVHIELMALAIQWLFKCKPVPLVGLHLGAVWLGYICLQQGCSSEAKRLLKEFTVLDWTLAKEAAKAGNRESILAIAIIQKAQEHLGQQLRDHQAERLSLDEAQTPQTSTILEDLMRYVLSTSWPSSI